MRPTVREYNPLAMPKPSRPKRVTLDSLAAMMLRSFERLESRIDGLDTRIGSLENNFQAVEMKITNLGNRLDDLAFNCVKYDDHRALEARVRRCEGKLGFA